MLYNIKSVPLHCVFHGIRFKVNEDWVSAIDTLLFFILLAQAAWLFISFARTKETKQRKFAVCIFLPTPILFSTEQKELASLKQLFVLNVPKSISALRQKNEAGDFWSGCVHFNIASFVVVDVFLNDDVFQHSMFFSCKRFLQTVKRI